MTKTIILGICLLIFAMFGFAQVKTETATEEFEEYERDGFGTPTPKPTRTPNPTPIPIRTPIRETPPPKPTPIPIRSVGKPGMKIWLQRLVSCDDRKSFQRVAPTTAFKTGDCLRLQFRLNFTGYLTIINLGTSGNETKIFPLESQSNIVSRATNTYLPDYRGWRFKGEPGNEQLIFIVSKSPVKNVNIDDYVGSKNFGEEDIESYDRDIVPRIENDEVYVLADETRIEKPIVFRLTIKHRGKK